MVFHLITKVKVKVKSLSCVPLFGTPWTVAYQAPPSMEFSRQEYWSGLPFPSPGDLPDPGIKPGSPALQADALPSEPSGKPLITKEVINSCSVVSDSLWPHESQQTGQLDPWLADTILHHNTAMYSISLLSFQCHTEKWKELVHNFHEGNCLPGRTDSCLIPVHTMFYIITFKHLIPNH